MRISPITNHDLEGFWEFAWISGKERTVFRGPFADWMRQASDGEILKAKKIESFWVFFCVEN